MLYLIDGYNLLHAIGLLSGKVSRTGLERARGRLLGLLHGALGDEAKQVTVVFDAARAPPGADAEQDYHGIQVRFAVGELEADDLIEQLIRKASAPKQLAVVSDDLRIQEAARRRRCTVLGCSAFLDTLENQRRQRPPTPEADAKPQGVSGSEKEHWLREFADLADDPDMKEAFNPFDFGDETELE
jgi:predicted RNA-binding protein with PIN domain